MGLPFYPWFSDENGGRSRQDVLNQKDAVRVKSCWGGMTAFNAGPFYAPSIDVEPLRFRATGELFWDASECCLIHADLLTRSQYQVGDQSWIFVNPYVRVGYTARTLSWLRFTRRFERLYSAIHNIINHLVGMPRFNRRRTEQRGETIAQMIWIPDSSVSSGGSYQEKYSKVSGDGYCGVRGMEIMRESPGPDGKSWEKVPVPPL